MSCKFYYFYCGDYHCGKCDKDVKEDWYYKYCRNYDYDDCPVYKGYMKEPANDSDGSSSGCFITSACVKAMGLPDNCYELQTLRHFRDNWLRCTEDGTAAISHYYIIAPKIVDEIEHSADVHTIYQRIYDQMIRPCVSLIENNQYKDAFTLYKNTVLTLVSDFAVSPAQL